MPPAPGAKPAPAGKNHRSRLEMERRPKKERRETNRNGSEICARLEGAIAAKLFVLSSMKTIPPSCPEPESGPKYWRSLEHLADMPEFRQWLDREFPSGASELSDPVSRRHFVKIMSASFM